MEGPHTVNLCILELPRWDLVLKHQVDFAKGTILGLRKAEPAPNIAEKIGPGIEEACFGAPVPGCRNCQHASCFCSCFQELYGDKGAYTLLQSYEA